METKTQETINAIQSAYDLLLTLTHHKPAKPDHTYSESDINLLLKAGYLRKAGRAYVITTDGRQWADKIASLTF